MVGISGGVDSSVTAHLLKKQGYAVVGVFLKGWHPPGARCGSVSDRQDAMRVCAQIGIPYHEEDTGNLFCERVIEPFFESYQRGETPNPDVLCNAEVKFAALARVADGIGASFIATGHYARKTEGGVLMGAKDRSKDQSYFLWNTDQHLLARALFPLGKMKKTAVRALARRIGLHTAEKKDSVGVCFVGDIPVRALLRKRLGVRTGTVRLGNGTIIGTHSGIWYYTQGQRIGAKMRRPHIPHFVIGKDPDANVLVASPNPNDTLVSHIRVSRPHLQMDIKKPLFLQTRHLGKRTKVRDIYREGNDIVCVCTTPVLAPPGQSAVWYTPEDVCVGGGTIR